MTNHSKQPVLDIFFVFGECFCCQIIVVKCHKCLTLWFAAKTIENHHNSCNQLKVIRELFADYSSLQTLSTTFNRRKNNSRKN